MSHTLVDFMEKSNFIRHGKLRISKIMAAPIESLLDFCTQFSEICIPTSIKERDKTIFSHSASLSLAGGRSPCKILECRLKRVESLSQFAALYSDRVYIQNFLYYHVLHADEALKEEDMFRKRFIEDLQIYLFIKPLLNSGNLIPVTFKGICPQCHSINIVNESNEKKYNSLRDEIVTRYMNEVDYSIGFEQGWPYVVARGSEELISHGSVVMVYNQPEGIPKAIKELKYQAKFGEELLIPKENEVRISLANEFATEVIKSLTFEIASSDILNTSFLSENELEINILRGLRSDPILQRRSSLMNNYMTCLLPILEGVKPDVLLRLRREEEESFILFRRALTSAIEEYKINGERFTERDAQAIYGDIIEPKLAELDKKFKSAKRLLVKDVRRKITSWAAALSVGFYTGFLTSNIFAGAATFGITKALAEFIENVETKSDAEEAVYQDEMYFLWKVRRESK